MATILIDILKQKNRNNTITTGDFFHVVDSSDIDFRIQGIQEDEFFDPGTTDGYRYIVRNVGLLHANFTDNGNTSDWGNNDILWFNGASAEYQVFLDSSNPENKQAGTIVFNEGDSKFYGFNGNEWVELGIGPGGTGAQGFQGVQGFQGFQGFQGVQGVQGFQGFQGNQGNQGRQGPTGNGISYLSGFVYNPNPGAVVAPNLILGTTNGTTGTYNPDFGPNGNTGDYFFGTNNKLYYCYKGGSYPSLFAEVQGRDGATGVQGFQGNQGRQGITGPAGSGKYFIGPTAPTEEDGVTSGSKWFNTNVGGEFTWIVDEDSSQWVMVNVFSATGPQGPLGGGTGNQGFQGLQGFQGSQGFQGLQGFQGSQGFQGLQGFQGNQGFQGLRGETGNGLFDTTYETNTITGNSINYTAIGSVSGSGRKIPLLLNDGSLTFDYLRTTDIFDQFKVSTFLYDGSTQQILEIGSGSYTLTDSFSATYSPSITQVNYASISISGVSSDDFPAELSSPYTTLDADGLTFAYPASANPTATVTFTLSSTASSGVEETATKSLNFLFRRPNYYGVDSNPSLGAVGLTSLSKVLDTNLSHSFEVDADNQYIYYAYPSTYTGTPTFKVNGFGGGFINIASNTPHTNEFGYITNYEIYRTANRFTALDILVEVT